MKSKIRRLKRRTRKPPRRPKRKPRKRRRRERKKIRMTRRRKKKKRKKLSMTKRPVSQSAIPLRKKRTSKFLKRKTPIPTMSEARPETDKSREVN